MNAHQLKKDLELHKKREVEIVKKRAKAITSGNSHQTVEASKELFSVRDKMAKIETKLGLKPSRVRRR